MKLIQKYSGKLKSFLKQIKEIFSGYNAYAYRITTTELVTKIVTFCELYSGLAFYPYQEQYVRRLVRSILENDGEELTALFSRQSGKSEAVSITAGGLMIILPQLANMPMFANDSRLEMFKTGFWIGIFAPSQRQASLTYNRIRSRLEGKHARLILDDPEFRIFFNCSNGQTVSLSNGSFVTAISASDGSNIEGESFKFIICEECLPKGSKILTEFGEKNVEDIKVGDKVLSYNHILNKEESKEVLRSFSQPLFNRKMVNLHLDNGAILRCTDNHKIYLNNKGYFRADTSKIEDSMLYYPGATQVKIQKITIEDPQDIEVYDLTVKDNANFFAQGVLVHNCQDISNFKITKSIHPMGAAYNATITKIGTSTTFKGNFYDVIERNKRKYANKELRIKNHFEYDCEVVSKYNPRYAKYVEKEKERLGETSDEFLMSYKLKWILKRSLFIDMVEFEKKNLDYAMETVIYDHDNAHILGIDVAGKNDSTVLTVVEVDWDNPVICESQINDEGQEETYTAYRTWIKCWLEILGDDYEEQYYTIVDFCKNFRISKCVIDATKEASMAHRLRANMPFEVIPYIFSRPSKSDMYKHLNVEVKSGRALVPAGENTKSTREYKQFMEQAEDLQKGYCGAYMVVSHPAGDNYHDDYCDSWALAVLGARDSIDSSLVETKDKTKVFKDYRNKKSFYSKRNKVTARRR